MLRAVLCLAALGLVAAEQVKVGRPQDTCTDRGGCSCDCSWATPDTCHNDDGSCCYACCCNSHPQPPPPTPPTPPVPPPPTPPAPTGDAYCPSAGDLTIAWETTTGQNVFLKDQGWTVNGGGGAATKSTFNLLGGSVEYDVDFSNTHTGVNANIYSVYPTGLSPSGYTPDNYCDGSSTATGDKWCVEVDWIESNGNCGAASTLHTRPGTGNDGCTGWGCRTSYHYGGKTSFHMKVDFGTDGSWTMTRDGQTISPSSLNPQPQAQDWQTVVTYSQQRGALVYSSQWTGWVPVEDCGTSGDLPSSSFSISNLVIKGKVVQGPTPTKCA